MSDLPSRRTQGPLDGPDLTGPVLLLSVRERDALQQLVNGRSFKQGSTELYISLHTFRTHVKNLLAKLGAHSSLEAVSVAVACGMRPEGSDDLAGSPPSTAGGVGAAAFDAAPDPMAVVGSDGVVMTVNHAMQDLFGSDDPPDGIDRLLGSGDTDTHQRVLDEVVHGGRSRFVLDRHLDHLPAGDLWVEAVITRLDESPDGPAAVVVLRDVTRARVLEDRLRWGAVHDELTGLGSRALVEERLDHALGHLARGGGGAGVLLLDIDRFGAINRKWGQSAGDRVLRDVAERLSAVVRPTDTVARSGADEFVICVENLAGDPAGQRAELRSLAERLREAVRRPDVGGMIGLVVDAAIGGAGSSEAGASPDELYAVGAAALVDARTLPEPGTVIRWVAMPTAAGLRAV